MTSQKRTNSDIFTQNAALPYIGTPLYGTRQELADAQKKIAECADERGRVPVGYFLNVLGMRHSEEQQELRYDVYLKKPVQIIHNPLGWMAKYPIIRTKRLALKFCHQKDIDGAYYG